MPSNVAARMTLAADPESLQGAVAAGILGAGSVVLGASEACARLLERGGDPRAVARDIRDADGRVPGFGHPVHTPVDPRAERIFELADERGVERRERRVRTRTPRRGARGVGQAARHERRHGDRGRLARSRLSRFHGEGGADPRADGGPARAPRRGAGGSRSACARARRGGGRRVRVILEPEVETRPWDEQLALDDAAFRTQLAYLRERSPFYREKLAGHGTSASATIERLPLTEKRELRDAHDAAARQASVRRAVGDRAHLFDERHDRHAELHPAHGAATSRTGSPARRAATPHRASSPATASSRRTTRGRSSPAPRSPSFDRIGLTHIPVGTGNTERLLQAIDELRPDAVVMTPSYAAYLAEREPRLAGSSVAARARRRRAGRRRARVPGEARGGLGREGHGGDGHRRHRRVPVGRMRGAERHAPRARAASSTWS